MERYPNPEPDEEPMTDAEIDYHIAKVPEQLPKPIYEDEVGAHSFIELTQDDVADEVEAEARRSAKPLYAPDIRKGDIPQGLIDAESGRYTKPVLEAREEKRGKLSRLYNKFFGKGGLWR